MKISTILGIADILFFFFINFFFQKLISVMFIPESRIVEIFIFSQYQVWPDLVRKSWKQFMVSPILPKNEKIGRNSNVKNFKRVGGGGSYVFSSVY